MTSSQTIAWAAVLLSAAIAPFSSRADEKRSANAVAIETAEKGVKVLGAQRVKAILISKLSRTAVGSLPMRESLQPKAGHSFVVVDAEVDFPRATEWDLSSFALVAAEASGAPLRAAAFTAGGASTDPEEETFVLAETGGAAIVSGTTVLMIANPLGRPRQIYFGFAQTADGKDAEWPGGKGAVRLVFETPQSAARLALAKKPLEKGEAKESGGAGDKRNLKPQQ